MDQESLYHTSLHRLTLLSGSPLQQVPCPSPTSPTSSLSLGVTLDPLLVGPADVEGLRGDLQACVLTLAEGATSAASLSP